MLSGVNLINFLVSVREIYVDNNETENANVVCANRKKNAPLEQSKKSKNLYKVRHCYIRGKKIYYWNIKIQNAKKKVNNVQVIVCFLISAICVLGIEELISLDYFYCGRIFREKLQSTA